PSDLPLFPYTTLFRSEHLSDAAGIECEIIDLNCLSHPDPAMIVESVRKTGRLLVADTSWKAFGVCAEVCRLVCEEAPEALRRPVDRKSTRLNSSHEWI